MNNEIYENLLEQGYATIENCLENQLIENIKENINKTLILNLKKYNTNDSKDLIKNYYNLKKHISQFDIQRLIGKDLVDNDLITKIFFSNKLSRELINLLGPDIEYLCDSEIAIIDKSVVEDDYLIKKYHQEFWSGMGLEAFQLWIPIHLLPGMGTIEVVKKSHTWGHIPHKNREPLEIPEDHESEILNPKVGSVVIMSALTLHRTVKNEHIQPRIALPLTIRNFYYPNTGNLDLSNFKKLNFSFFSRMRKILGNPHYSPFRSLGQKRTDFFKKNNYSKK